MTDRQSQSKRRRRGSGEGSVYKRSSDNRWVAVFDGGRDARGKRIRRTAYAKTRKEAAAELPRLKAEARKQLAASRVDLSTVGGFFNSWLETKVKVERAPKTYESYEAAFRLHINPAIGSIRLDRIKRSDVQAMLNALGAKEGVGPRSVENVRAVCRNAFNDAIKWDLLESNPAEHTSVKPVPRTDRRFLTVDEANQLFESVAKDRFEALYIMAAVYGLRRGECLGLRWQDIDEDGQAIRIRQQVVVVQNKPMITTLKTEHSRRTLPLLGIVADALERRRERQAEERLLAGDRWDDHDLVFASQVGTPYQPANLHKQFKRHLETAGLADTRLHELRHTASSFLVANNVHPRVAMEILGHSDIKTTMEIYSHVSKEGMRDALESIERALAVVKKD